MADAALQSILTHNVDVYHVDVTVAADGQQLEGYPAAPDIAALDCAIATDGKTLQESAVGYMIESEAILYCEQADIRERDKVVFGTRTFRVNGTPSAFYNIFDAAAATTPHLLEVGLKEEKSQPA